MTIRFLPFLFLISFSLPFLFFSCEEKVSQPQAAEAEVAPVPEPDVHEIAKAYLEKIIRSSEWQGFGVEPRLEAIRIYLRFYPEEKEGR